MRKSLLFSFALGIVASAHLEPVLARAYADVPKSALYVDDGDQNLIQGVVNSAAGPVPGVTVSVVGTSYSTQTDANGRFRINAQRGSTLRFTNVGYRSKDAVVGTGNEIVVSLEAQEAAIEEVLVTAEFGVKRTGRAVGSSVQQIDGATISESGREHFISALAGRAPGLNVTSTSGSPGASTTVVLRNITSISGNNQPLYVIDGVPMNNSSFDPLGGMAGGGSGTYSVRNLDFSSRGNDFNPEDVESVTVL